MEQEKIIKYINLNLNTKQSEIDPKTEIVWDQNDDPIEEIEVISLIY